MGGFLGRQVHGAEKIGILYSSLLPAQHVVHIDQVPPDFKVRGPGNDQFGSSLAGGDVNGDGKEDLIGWMTDTADYPVRLIVWDYQVCLICTC